MPIESDADRLEYVTALGEAVDFDRAAETWVKFGIFDNEYIDVDGMASKQPVLVCRLIDIYQPGEVQSVAFRAESVRLTAGGYDIKEFHEDGLGMVQLVLELQ